MGVPSTTFLSIILSALAVWSVDNHTLEAKRIVYQQAQQALNRGEIQTFEKHIQTLSTYPLYPYLLFADLKRRLDTAKTSEIQDFLDTYNDSPLSVRLRKAWLHELAQAQRWQEFIEFYTGSADAEFVCYHLRARLNEGEVKGIKQEIKRLWLVGHSQPKACDPLFSWLEKRGELSPALIWKRIEHAMQKNNPKLARYLSKKLAPKDRRWARLWITANAEPLRIIREKSMRDDRIIVRKILSFAVKRSIDKDIVQGKAIWDTIKPRYSFSKHVVNEIDRYLALKAAYRHHPNAMYWLENLPKPAVDRQVKVWRVRTAMLNSDWDAVLNAIEDLNLKERRRDIWQYWQARALSELAHDNQSNAIFTNLAKKRSYYGFLAADRLGMNYSITPDPIIEDAAAIKSLLAIAAIQRARELYKLNQFADARLEWEWALRGLNPHRLKLAAKLADRWGEHSDAIRTVAKARHFDDLELRFPTPFITEIRHAARRFDLEISFIYGVIRRESAFQTDAQSSAGALGLMQLIPSTATSTSRQLGLTKFNRNDLFDRGINIQLGSAYMRHLLDEFNNSVVLATAAYNAGPHRVNRWLPQCGQIEADLWIDTFPFYETRRYVRAVLAYTAIFEWKLKTQTTRLSERMNPISRPSIG